MLTRRTGDEIAVKLQTLARRLDRHASVSNVRRLSGGAMQETFAFDLLTGDGATPLILRRARHALRQNRKHGLSLANEARAIGLLNENGVPAPRIVAVLRDGDDLGDGFISAFVDGETIPRRILRDDAYAALRPRLAAECGEVLANLHGLPTEPFEFLDVHSPALALARMDEQYRALDRPGPVFEIALRWLGEHLPDPPRRLAIVHGDFRNGNFIVGPEGLRAVLDWEGVHLGDPAEDLAYLTVRSWRFGQLDRAVGGFGTRRQLVDAYHRAGGKVPSARRLRFWEVAFTLWWGLVCAEMARQFSAGEDWSVERGAVGRRRSEAEIDLVDLLGSEA
jgi:aminoglycoside phosphotransferase (APT) family kinase protein